MGESIGRYDVLSVIAAGDAGTVYRARDTKVGRTVAIRVISRGMSDPAQRARAIDLIQPYTALTHPHVAALFEVGEQRGAIYLVYEFVPGDKLGALIAGRPMNLRRALDLGAQAADALAEAHSLDLVHGALTPSSIVITPKGHAKILDFGLLAGTVEDVPAASSDLQAADRQAARFEALGRSRIAYAAPEQLLGQPPDSRSDLFALGAILHEMLTGQHAFAGRSPADLGARVLRSRPAMPSVLNRGLSHGLDATIAKALDKRPDRRYQSAAAMAADIRAAAGAAQSEAVALDEARASAPAPRSWRRIVIMGIVLLAATAAALWYWQGPLRQAWLDRFGAKPEPLLAVLAFQVDRTDTSRPYFGAGFAEDLAQRLGYIPGVEVLGRSLIRTSAGKQPQPVAAAAHARVLVSGTLTPADEDWTSVQVESRLVDSRDGRVIWNGSYTCGAADIVALQARMASDIAAWLKVPYKATPERGRTALRLVTPAAYDTYLRARDALVSDDASRAAQLFESAASEDPSLVEARAGLAVALYTASVFEGREHYGDIRPRAREAAEAAFATDPDIVPTRLAMGLTAATLREALEHLKRAAELDASNAMVYLALADVLRPIDPARATRLAQRAAELDPGEPLAHFQMAVDSLSTGEFGGALLAATRGQALAPALPWWEPIRLRARLAGEAGAPGAVPASGQTGREAGDFPPGTILRAAELATSGRTGDALTLLGSLSRLHPGSCEARAMTAATLFRGARQAEALQIAGSIASKAAAAPDGSGWTRCAVMAAAAVNDSWRAAAALTRIASSERELRAWGAVNGLLDGMAAMRQDLFPWGNVAKAPAVVDAMKRLDTALLRSRGDAATLLGGM